MAKSIFSSRSRLEKSGGNTVAKSQTIGAESMIGPYVVTYLT